MQQADSAESPLKSTPMSFLNSFPTREWTKAWQTQSRNYCSWEWTKAWQTQSRNYCSWEWTKAWQTQSRNYCSWEWTKAWQTQSSNYCSWEWTKAWQTQSRNYCSWEWTKAWQTQSRNYCSWEWTKAWQTQSRNYCSLSMTMICFIEKTDCGWLAVQFSLLLFYLLWRVPPDIETLVQMILWIQTKAEIEGSRPESCISSMIYSRDTPFWSETLEILPLERVLLFLGCVTSKQHVRAPQRLVCLHTCICCQTVTPSTSNSLSGPLTVYRNLANQS